MEDKLKQLKTRLARVEDLARAASVLDWDQETYMPDGGGQARADQLATLGMLSHQYFVDEEVGALFDDLAEYASQLPYESDDASLIRVGMREYHKLIRVPTALVEEMMHTFALAQQNWRTARAQNNFKLFEPWLEKNVELARQYAACFDPPGNPYDILLDKFEPGIDYAQLDAIFSALKPRLVALIKDIVAHKDAVDDSVMHQHFDHAAQIEFSKQVGAAIGYSFERGRLDLSAHPFSIHFSRDDARITTRVNEDFLPTCLMGVIHECGHAMYEQGTSPSLYRLGLGREGGMAQGASYGTHESQSRFYENVLGRSRPFWKTFYPKAQAFFPNQLGSVPMEKFYRALNKVEPGLIRVEADEVTYGLHIMLRFELENDLINRRVQVSDLPKIWNDRMESYLGVRPPNDSDGVLQDIHWSSGYFGYFPDYLLGSIFSLQLWEKMQQDNPNVIAQVEAGDFADILAWLREKIHQHGKKFTLPELAERATGQPLTWEPYINYLEAKYGEIYGL